MSLEREGIPPKQIQLLYARLDTPLSIERNSALKKLQKENILYSENDRLIVSKHLTPPSFKYVIYDGRNGLVNYAAMGTMSDESFVIEKGFIFEAAQHQNPNPLERPYLDRARTVIERSPDLSEWQGSVTVYRNEFDDLAVIRRALTVPFRDLPSEKNLEEEMEKIAEQISMLTENRKVKPAELHRANG